MMFVLMAMKMKTMMTMIVGIVIVMVVTIWIMVVDVISSSFDYIVFLLMIGSEIHNYERYGECGEVQIDAKRGVFSSI